MSMQDNSDKVKSAIHQAAKQAMEVVGGMLESYRKKNITTYKWQHKTANRKNEKYHAAIDTGLLRNSITYAVSGGEAHDPSYRADDGSKSGSYSGTAPEESGGVSVYVGSNVEYAGYIELGVPSSDIPAVHYLSDAVNQNQKRLEKAIADTMAKASK